MATLAHAHDDSDDWLAGRCPLHVVADSVRGDSAKFRTLLFLAICWVEHEPHCAATER